MKKVIPCPAVNNVIKYYDYMDVDVILTFNTANKIGETQEFFNTKLYVHFRDGDAISFLNKKFFPRVLKACLKRHRSHKDLVKISTAANWDIYEKLTNHARPMCFGNNGKWNFGEGRNDLDVWEKCLMRTFGFGTDAEMQWISNLSAERENLRDKIIELAEKHLASVKG